MEIPCAFITKGDGIPTVSLRGEVDFRNARIVTQAVEYAGEDAGAVVVLDLGAVTFIDSSGISALVRSARGLREQGRALRLTRASRHITQLLRTAGFTRFFLYDSLETEEPWGASPTRDFTECGGIWQHTSFTIPARLSLISYVRGKISEMVQSLPTGEEHLDTIRLAVGEAASNAVRHGCAGNEGWKVSIECSTDGEEFLVEITDPGPGFDPDGVPMPLAGELREGGMGIHFMRITMDEVRYCFDDRGTTVRLKKRLLPGAPAVPRELVCQPVGAP